jgi:hypothetical protein
MEIPQETWKWWAKWLPLLLFLVGLAIAIMGPFVINPFARGYNQVLIPMIVGLIMIFVAVIVWGAQRTHRYLRRVEEVSNSPLIVKKFSQKAFKAAAGTIFFSAFIASVWYLQDPNPLAASRSLLIQLPAPILEIIKLPFTIAFVSFATIGGIFLYKGKKIGGILSFVAAGLIFTDTFLNILVPPLSRIAYTGFTLQFIAVGYCWKHLK